MAFEQVLKRKKKIKNISDRWDSIRKNLKQREHDDFKKLEDPHGCNMGWQRRPRTCRLVHLFKMFGLHPKGQCSQQGLSARVSSQSWVFQDDFSCGVEALEEGEQM